MADQQPSAEGRPGHVPVSNSATSAMADQDVDIGIDEEMNGTQQQQQQQQKQQQAVGINGQTTAAPNSSSSAAGAAVGSSAEDMGVQHHDKLDATNITEALPESRIPAKKDASLREFLGKMDDCAPIIPDAVTNYYLTLAGLPPPPATPLPLARLLALATQKFIADVAADAYQYSRIRASNSSSNPMMSGLPTVGPTLPGAPGAAGAVGKDGEKGDKGKAAGLGVQRAGFGGGGQGSGQGRTVLTMEDLGMAIGDYGISVRRGEFYR